MSLEAGILDSENHVCLNKVLYLINDMPIKPRALEFRLSPESANRIKERIDNCELPILKDVSSEESKLLRLGRIAEEASRILSEKNQSTDGCSNEESVRDWLNRKRGKKITIFIALCETVDENWREVFDKSFYVEILKIEQEKIVELFANSIYEIFRSPFDNDKSVFDKYRQQIGQIIGTSEFESRSIKELIEAFVEEFAINGRQIRFQVNSLSNLCPIIELQVEGKNQDDIFSTWRLCDKEPYTYVVEIENWWWKGNIDFKLKFLSNNEELNCHCNVFVPEKGYKWVNVLLDFDAGICNIK
jgi:hypothetical protein